MTLPSVSLTPVFGTSPHPVAIDEVMAPSTVDARGLDLFALLSPLGDTVAAVGLVSVVRADGLPLASADLTTAPAGLSAPWVSPNWAGVPAMAVNWWQTVGPFAQVSTDGLDVTYLLAVSLTTTSGRQLTFVVTQVVSPTVS